MGDDKVEEKYFNILMKLAIKASKKNEVPVSALIVKNGKIIAKAYNKRNKSKYIMDHAELLVIKKASEKLKDWRLNNCDLYVTLKPCSICESAIKQSRIKNVYYLLEKPNNKKEYSKTKFGKTNIRTQEEKYNQILSGFFAKKRDK